MFARCCAVAALLIVLLAGCHRRGPYMDAYFELLDAEKRQLEDQVYLYQGKYEKTLAELDACRQEIQKLRGGAAPDSSSGSGAGDVRVPDTGVPEVDIPDLSPPTVDPGTPIEPPSTGPSSENDTPTLRQKPTTGSSGRGATDRLPGPRITPSAPISAPAEELQSNTIPPRASDQLSHIVLNHRYTRGTDFDNQPGDDGITVVVQPRTADNRAVSRFGRISIVLLDPRLMGDEARFARWDFSPDQVHQAMNQAADAKEIRLQMKWPDQSPRHNRLHLFVRMVTEQGERFEADREIYINLPLAETAQWTPRHKSSASDQEVAVAARSHEQLTDQNSPPSANRSAIPTNNASTEPAPPAGDHSQPQRPKWSPFREDMR